MNTSMSDNQTPPVPPAAYSVREVARSLRVTEVRVRREIHEGRLRALRVGRLLRVPAPELERYLEEALLPSSAR